MYTPEKHQIPAGFVEWTFTNNPDDGEVVEILRYGKVETLRFNKQYMAFNPKCVLREKEDWCLGWMIQEGITHFKRIDV